MSKYKDLFLSYMDQNDHKYTDLNENTVRVGYNCENVPSVSVIVTFDNDNSGTVHFVAWSIAKFAGDKFANGLVVCNMLNQKYRWVRFYLDSDQEVCADMDAILDQSTAGKECFQCIIRLVDIVDEVYPEFMRAIYA